mmetsp:Transcript_36101/g.85475  ORF Transcript_36101/g.85475 Transcript_36101/m.85475 type:complete len:334 (+) Transcript_36101:2375-3376(+)
MERTTVVLASFPARRSAHSRRRRSRFSVTSFGWVGAYSAMALMPSTCFLKSLWNREAITSSCTTGVICSRIVPSSSSTSLASPSTHLRLPRFFSRPSFPALLLRIAFSASAASSAANAATAAFSAALSAASRSFSAFSSFAAATAVPGRFTATASTALDGAGALARSGEGASLASSAAAAAGAETTTMDAAARSALSQRGRSDFSCAGFTSRSCISINCLPPQAMTAARHASAALRTSVTRWQRDSMTDERIGDRSTPARTLSTRARRYSDAHLAESSRPAGASTESASGRCLSTVSIEICSAQADRHAITSSRTCFLLSATSASMCGITNLA